MATKEMAREKGQAGYGGYPVGTIAFYGPDNRRAMKVAVGIIPAPRSELAEMRRWFGETGDVRVDETVFAEIVTFLREHRVQSVAMTEKILSCPHEEGIDYPNGEVCLDCPYWAVRDRWRLSIGSAGAVCSKRPARPCVSWKRRWCQTPRRPVATPEPVRRHDLQP
jgi:hypothetical protein